jgi:hypothetical protein
VADTVGERSASKAPREVVLAAGDWIGGQLQEDGFEWLPGRLTLERSVGTLRHQIHFQPSKSNRRGGSIKVQSMLNVRDVALRQWRKTNSDRAIEQGDFVCGHFLGYASGRTNGYLYGDFEDGEIDLTKSAERDQHLRAWVSTVRGAVLPWFADASDPDLIIGSRAADKTAAPGCIVEWLASRGRADLVPAFLDRYLERHSGWGDGVARGAALAVAGLRPGPTSDWPVELGWLVARVAAA